MNADSVSVTVAQFSRLEDVRARCVTVPWAKLAERLQKHQRRGDRDGPGWSPAIYPEGARRAKEHVEAVTALVLDCDNGPPPWALLSEWAYAGHTTWKHTEAAPRWRVAIPLAAPVPSPQWPEVWARAQYRFCTAMDAACKDASRFYWWPACPADAQPHAVRHDGPALDPAELPSVPATPLPPAPRAKAANAGERPGDGFNTQATWESILAPHGWTRVYVRGDEGHWRRPGKRDGTSATTNYGGSDVLYVFTSNAAPFAPGASYTKFGAFAVLEADGDHEAAARLLAERGYGAAAHPRVAPRENLLELDWWNGERVYGSQTARTVGVQQGWRGVPL